MRVVRAHASLPYIDAHFDHIRNQRCSIGIGMMDDQFYTIFMEVSVDLLIGIQEEIFKHSRRNERGLLASPVIMMEDSLRVQMTDNIFCLFQFEVSDDLDNVMNLIRIFIQRDQETLDLHKVMAVFKDSWCHHNGKELVIFINFISDHFRELPCFIRESGCLRCMQIILPVLNILDQDLIRCMYRECTWCSFRPGHRNAP